jgi:hypothetical protein
MGRKWPVRYLIVAHHETDEEHQAVMKGLAPPETGHEAIAEKTNELIAEDPDARFHLLMLATPSPDKRWTWTREEALELAQKRLDFALRFAESRGHRMTGEVGNEYLVDSIEDVIRREKFDAIILSTRPLGASKVVGLDIVARTRRLTSVPVIHVIDRTGRSSGPSPG